MEPYRRDKKTVPRVAIVGCGNIGSRLDEALSGGEAILSHAGAYQRSGRSQLVALCDVDPTRLEECGTSRGVSALYTDYRALLRSESVDILSICTPVTQRLPILAAALSAGVRAIFCEKPFAADLAEGEQMRLMATQHGASVAVNYLRRWDPAVQEMARIIKSGRLGVIQHVVGYYGKGISNNGSHLIDLLNLCFGPPARAAALRRVEDEYNSADPSLDCALEYEAEGGYFTAYLLASDYRHFSVFELDVMGAKGRVRMTEEGRRIQLDTVCDDPVFTGYRTLRPTATVTGELDNALLYAVEDVLDVFEGSTQKPRCGIEEALDALRVVDAVTYAVSSIP